jgi:hypothetical protein
MVRANTSSKTGTALRRPHRGGGRLDAELAGPSGSDRQVKIPWYGAVNKQLALIALSTVHI